MPDPSLPSLPASGQKLYQMLLENAAVGIILFDLNHKILYINPCGAAWMRRSPENIIGKTASEIIPREWENWIGDHLGKVIQESKGHTFEDHFSWLEGEVWFLSQCQPLISPSGQVSGVQVVFQDITDQKLAEEQAYQAEHKIHHLFETMQEGIWVIDRDAVTTFVNPHMAAMLGYTPEEMIGRHLFDFMDEQGVKLAECDLERRRQGISESHDFEFLRKDGSRVYVNLATTPLMDSEENYLGAIAGVVDISGRRRMELALNESRENLSAMLNAIRESAMLVTADGTILAANETVATRMGREVKDLIGMNAFALVPAEVARWRRKCLDQAVQEKRIIRFEDERFGKVFDNTIYPIVDSDSRVIRAAILGIDITEKKRVEKALIESEERFRITFSQAAIGITISDAQGNWLRANPYFCSLVGYTEEELQALTFQHITYSGDLGKDLELTGLLRAGRINTFNMEKRYIRKDGSPVWVNLNVSRVNNTQGEMAYVVGIVEDINARKRAEDAGQRARQIAEALQASSMAIGSTPDFNKIFSLILEQASKVISFDSASVQLAEDDHLVIVSCIGFEAPDKVTGMKVPLDDFHPNKIVFRMRRPIIIGDAQEEFPMFKEYFSDHIHSWMGIPLIVQDRIIGMLTLDSKELNHFTEDDKRVSTAFASQVAIALENTRLFAQVQQLAITDTLTGISNRRHFFTLGENEIFRALRYKKPFALIMLDIDHFKQVNDTYGHVCGDQVLEGLAHLCCSVLRKVDIIGRYGGEEFAIILPETRPAQAHKVAERLRREIAATGFETLKGPIHITVSMGVVSLKTPIGSLESVLECADQAMYQAKQSGRNRVFLYKERNK